MKRLLCTALAVAMMMALTACNEKETKKEDLPPPPPPPPPTAEELAGLAMDQLNPLLVETVRDSTQAKGVLSAEINKLGREPNGNLAELMIVNELRGKAKVAREAKQWHFGLVLCDLLEIIEKDSRIDRYRQEATLEIQRPQVKIAFYIEDELSDEVHWLLELRFPETGKVVKEKHRKGDEFYGYVFRDIIGDRKGIRLKYKPTDALYDIMKE